MTAPDARFVAWMDDDAEGRCTATRTLSSSDGPVTVRCDGQAGHGGYRHQGSREGHTIVWAVTDE